MVRSNGMKRMILYNKTNMQSFQECDQSFWAIAPSTTNSRGNKQATILSTSGNISNSTPIAIQLTEKDNPLNCPFGASNWADAPSCDRFNLDFAAPDDLLCFFNKADEKIVELAQDASENLFGKKLSMDESGICISRW